MQINYIKHLTAVFYRMADDERLSPFHISLYFTLFQFWNLNRFKNPISIARQETMRLSKIGSVNTYIKCIKELDKWNYLKYIPSHNPMKGSLVNLYNFNNTTDNAIDISNDKSLNKTSEKTNSNTKRQLVIPSINTINNTNQLNSLNEPPPQLTKKNNLISKSDDTEETKQRNRRFEDATEKENKVSSKKIAPKKESNQLQSQAKNKAPSSQEVANYFASKLCSANEGEKFFNYFESNGWLVGGKTPMKNWHAAANNWILNIDKFKNNGTHKQESKSGAAAGQNNSRAGNLHANTDKNFSEPL